MTTATSDLRATALAEMRARLHATAVAEYDPDLLDPHGDEARGVDPDALYDAAREDRL